MRRIIHIRRIIPIIIFGLLLLAYLIDAPPTYTNQYNQSGAPFIAFGGTPSGDFNNLNVSGEGLTYDIPENKTSTNITEFYDDFESWDTTADCTFTSAWTACYDTADSFIRGNAVNLNNGSVALTTYDWDSDGFLVDEGLFKCVNLTNYSNAYLTFWWRKNLLDVGEYGRIDINTSATGFTNIFDSGTGSTAAFAERIIDVTSNISDRTCIGIHQLANAISEWVNYDDLRIIGTFNNYSVDVWHNSSPVSYPGTLTSVNATIRFNSTVAAIYNLSIYNWAGGTWNSTLCQGVNAAANTYYQLWCNVTQSPADYISTPDNVVRIRINNTPHRYNGTLIEDYVQFYVSYLDTAAPRWRNNGSNTTTPVENESVLLFAQGNDEFLAYAALETNESGVWQNKSGFYGSPMNLSGNTTWTWSNFTWRNTSVLENTQVCWRIWYNDSSDNRNGTDINCFTVQPPCSIAMGLSANLTNPGINWTISSLPASYEPAWGNNGDGNTTYNVTISATGCDAGLWIRANDDLRSNGDFIGLGNETYRWNRTNATVPGDSYVSLTQNDANITSPLSGVSAVYFKFFLNVSSGQPPGVYNNTVYFKANRSAS